MEKLNILILDSNNKDRQELRKIIESTDSDFIYEIMEVANPQKAAQLLSERRIDIMLTEIFDSIETGTDIIGYAREKGVNPHIHIVIVSRQRDFESPNGDRAWSGAVYLKAGYTDGDCIVHGTDDL